MATATRPLSDRPSSARVSSRACQLGISGASRVHSAAAHRAATITGLRPTASDSGPVSSRPMARVAVATDSTRLLCAALTAKVVDSTGSIGCTQ
ncbi:hypothetical protein D3C78_1697820 [compost metagenome]